HPCVCRDHRFTVVGIEAQVQADRRDKTRVRLPDGATAWLGDRTVHFATTAGRESTWALPETIRVVRVVGHGLVAIEVDKTGCVAFDLVHRRELSLPSAQEVIAVSGWWLCHDKTGPWVRLDGADGARSAAPGLTPNDRLL